MKHAKTHNVKHGVAFVLTGGLSAPVWAAAAANANAKNAVIEHQLCKTRRQHRKEGYLAGEKLGMHDPIIYHIERWWFLRKVSRQASAQR